MRGMSREVAKREHGAFDPLKLGIEPIAALEEVLRGEADEVGFDDLGMILEFHTPLAREDHLRLIRVASLALQYWERIGKPRGQQRAFMRKMAAACNVHPDSLASYVLVVSNEMAYRRRMNQSALENLPKLRASDVPKIEEALALPAAGSQPKHDPEAYVELAETGLNNTEIAARMDVSEAAVRRGLRKAGFQRN